MALLPGKNTADPQLKAPTITKPSGVVVNQQQGVLTPSKPTASPSLTTVGSGASTGGSYGGYVPPATPSAPPVPSPAAGGAAGAPGDSTKQGSDSTQAMLDAALAAIEAEYGLTASQLMMDESDVGRRYRLLLAESMRLGQQQAEQVQAGALDRGILQSGIYAADQAELQQALAEQNAQYEQQKAAELARIKAQQAALPAQQAAAQAAAAQQAAQAGLDLDLIKAAANGGI